MTKETSELISYVCEN